MTALENREAALLIVLAQYVPAVPREVPSIRTCYAVLTLLQQRMPIDRYIIMINQTGLPLAFCILRFVIVAFSDIKSSRRQQRRVREREMLYANQGLYTHLNHGSCSCNRSSPRTTFDLQVNTCCSSVLMEVIS